MARFEGRLGKRWLRKAYRLPSNVPTFESFAGNRRVEWRFDKLLKNVSRCGASQAIHQECRRFCAKIQIRWSRFGLGVPNTKVPNYPYNHSIFNHYHFYHISLLWFVRGGQPHDKDNFVLLVKELKESFRPFNLLVTSAFGASKKIIDEAYDIPALSKYLDFLHVMW